MKRLKRCMKESHNKTPKWQQNKTQFNCFTNVSSVKLNWSYQLLSLTVLSEGSLFTPPPPLKQGFVLTFIGLPHRTLHTFGFLVSFYEDNTHITLSKPPLYTGECILRRKHFNKMSLTVFWMVLLGCLDWCHAAPTIAPTVSPEDEDFAQVMQCTLHKY